MISSVPWSWSETGEAWGATVGRRELAIRWDSKDSVLYLSCVVAPAANVTGGSPRVYTAPVSLLAAMLILPDSEHPRLVGMAQRALVELRDAEVIAALPVVVGQSIEPWPAPARAHEALKRALAAMPDVERLSLDVAAAGAWGD